MVFIAIFFSALALSAFLPHTTTTTREENGGGGKSLHHQNKPSKTQLEDDYYLFVNYFKKNCGAIWVSVFFFWKKKDEWFLAFLYFSFRRCSKVKRVWTARGLSNTKRLQTNLARGNFWQPVISLLVSARSFFFVVNKCYMSCKNTKFDGLMAKRV